MKRTTKLDGTKHSERIIEITLEVASKGDAKPFKRSVMKIARSSKKPAAKSKRRS